MANKLHPCVRPFTVPRLIKEGKLAIEVCDGENLVAVELQVADALDIARQLAELAAKVTVGVIPPLTSCHSSEECIKLFNSNLT